LFDRANLGKKTILGEILGGFLFTAFNLVYLKFSAILQKPLKIRVFTDKINCIFSNKTKGSVSARSTTKSPKPLENQGVLLY